MISPYLIGAPVIVGIGAVALAVWFLVPYGLWMYLAFLVLAQGSAVIGLLAGIYTERYFRRKHD